MRIRFQLIIFMFLRIVMNTMHRMVYPFLAVFARGLGVDITTLSFVVTARSFFGLFAPVVGGVVDHRGRRFGMLAAIVLFTLGMASVAIHPNFVTFSLAILLAVLSKYLFDPSMQAYLGDRIPYERRGTALAVTEVAWSLAFIAGVPLVGYLIARYGWDAPFPLFAGLGFVMFAAIWWMIPHAPQSQPTGTSIKNVRAVLTSIPALAGISIVLWASAANELVNLIFGVWLERLFGLKIAALAGASAVIGISELGGEGTRRIDYRPAWQTAGAGSGSDGEHPCLLVVTHRWQDGDWRAGWAVFVLYHIRICIGKSHPPHDRSYARCAGNIVVVQCDGTFPRAHDRCVGRNVYLSTVRISCLSR